MHKNSNFAQSKDLRCRQTRQHGAVRHANSCGVGHMHSHLHVPQLTCGFTISTCRSHALPADACMHACMSRHVLHNQRAVRNLITDTLHHTKHYLCSSVYIIKTLYILQPDAMRLSLINLQQNYEMLQIVVQLLRSTQFNSVAQVCLSDPLMLVFFEEVAIIASRV